MENNKSEYYLGVCKGCGKTTALKDGGCVECNKTANKQFEDFFKDIIRERPNGL